MPSFISEVATFCRAKHGRVTQLADHLGIAQPHVSAWLTGRQEPSGEHTLRIQAWLASQTSERGVESAPVTKRPSRRIERPSAPASSEEEVPVWLL